MSAVGAICWVHQPVLGTKCSKPQSRGRPMQQAVASGKSFLPMTPWGRRAGSFKRATQAADLCLVRGKAWLTTDWGCDILYLTYCSLLTRSIVHCIVASRALATGGGERKTNELSTADVILEAILIASAVCFPKSLQSVWETQRPGWHPSARLNGVEPLRTGRGRACLLQLS